MTYDTLIDLLEAGKKHSGFEHVLHNGIDRATSTLNDAHEVVAILKKRCAPFLKEAGGYPALRGASAHNMGPEWKVRSREIRQDRRPLGSDKHMHKAMDEYFAHAGFVANRSNSLFVSGTSGSASGYGTLAVVYPIGEFHYTWSPKIRDAYGEFDSPVEESEEPYWDLQNDCTYAITYSYKTGKGGWKSAKGYVKRKVLSKVMCDVTDMKCTIPPSIRKELKTRMKDEAFNAWFVRRMQYYAKCTGMSDNAALTALVLFEIGRSGDSGASALRKSLMQIMKREIDPYEQFKKKGQYQADDGSLSKALKSSSEIMITAKEAIFVEYAFYNHYIKPLLAGKTITDPQKTYKQYLNDAQDYY